LLANLTFVVKIALFDPNYPFHPICHGGRHVGLVVLNEPMSLGFKQRMQVSLANSRQLDDRVLYISYWTWRHDKEALWNVTRSAAEYVYEQENRIKRMSQAERERLQTARCKFIRKHALRKPNAR